eukprot:g32183.t1
MCRRFIYHSTRGFYHSTTFLADYQTSAAEFLRGLTDHDIVSLVARSWRPPFGAFPLEVLPRTRPGTGPSRFMVPSGPSVTHDVGRLFKFRTCGPRRWRFSVTGGSYIEISSSSSVGRDRPVTSPEIRTIKFKLPHDGHGRQRPPKFELLRLSQAVGT